MNFIDAFLDKTLAGDMPNKFTLGMGKQIRAAREEAGYSQRDLSSLIYRRQAALSSMENGLMQPDAETLLLLAYNLKKPISYFFPAPFKPDIDINELSEKEKELLFLSRQLLDEDLLRIIAQIKGLVNFAK